MESLPNTIFISHVKKTGPLDRSTGGFALCKLNFDSSMNSSTGLAGIGSIIKGNTGNMVMAHSGQIISAHPLEAELQSLMQGTSMSA